MTSFEWAIAILIAFGTGIAFGPCMRAEWITNRGMSLEKPETLHD